MKPLVRVLFLILLLPATICGQGVTFGVDWNPPASITESTKALDLYSEIGISAIQIEGILSRQLIDSVKSRGFELWVSSGVKYPRRFDFNNHFDSLTTAVTDPLYYYRGNNIPVARYTVFENPQNFDAFGSVWEQFESEILRLHPGIFDMRLSAALYQNFFENSHHSVTIQSFPDAQKLHVSGIPLFFESPSLDFNTSRKLRELVSSHENGKLTLFFPSEYLDVLMESDRNLADVIKAYSIDKKNVIALPAAVEPTDSDSVLIFVLLVAWTLLIITVSSSGSYYRCVYRYFFTHNFFVDDILNRRTKAGGEILLGFILAVIFGVLMFYAYLEVIMTGSVVELLHHHVPSIAHLLTGSPFLKVITLVTAILFLQLLGLLLILPSTIGNIRFSQILQIYFVPQQLLIPVATLFLLLLLNGLLSYFWLTALPIFGIIILITPALFTMLDVAGLSAKSKARFWITGPILYIILLAAGIMWVRLLSPVYDTFALINQLHTF